MTSREDTDRATADAGATIPMRRCIATGETRPKHALIRFVVDPDGGVVPDVAERLPGRGLWLSADRNVVNTAARKGIFARASRGRVSVPQDLVTVVEDLLARRCQEILGLARRAGQAIAGFEKVMAAVAAARKGLVLTARDGGQSGRSKIAVAARGMHLFDVLTGSELGVPFGKRRVAHAYVAPGRLADMLHRDLERLAGLRGEAEAEQTGVVNDDR